MPLFSIIIPTKNRSSLLKLAIESVLNQKYENFELIIVDDHSDDNTKDVVRTFNDRRIIYTLNKSKERSAARNTGIDIAQGDYICFLDDDDYYTENYLLDFYNYLRVHDFPKDVILRTGFIKKYENGKEKKSAMYDERKHKNAVKFAAYNMCGVWSLCIPANILFEGKFDERFPHWQDTHLILRIIQDNIFVQQQNYNYRYRIHMEMGSIVALNSNIINERCRINIHAIEDYFENHKTSSILKNDTKNYLIAEKYLQYSPNFKNKQDILYFLNKSLKVKFSFKFWKYYLMIIKSLLK